MKAIVFGASGGLATALADRLLVKEWAVDLVTRTASRLAVEARFAASLRNGQARVLTAGDGYSDFASPQRYDAHFFMQAIFEPRALIEMTEVAIATEIEVGLTGPIRLTGDLLGRFPVQPGVRADFCYMGSTSAYAGFRATAAYCAVKHGLLGFVRAMNDEYAETDARFWLFSMGTIDTAMGAKVVSQDPSTFLHPADVADRIAAAVERPTNIFEPEVIMRRRTIRRLGG